MVGRGRPARPDRIGAPLRDARVGAASTKKQADSVDATLALPQPFLDAMIAHARADDPNECCGVVLRFHDGSLRLYRATNAEASPYRFSIAPGELHYLFRTIEEQGADLLVVYHSHTQTEAQPSPTDASFSRLLDGPDEWPYWVIVSLAHTPPPLRAWRMKEGRATEIALTSGALPPQSACVRLHNAGDARKPQIVEVPLS